MASKILGTLAAVLTADTAQFMRGMKSAREELNKTSQHLRNVGVQAGAAFGVGALTLGSFVKRASDAQEQMNVLRLGFGKSTDEVIGFGKQLARTVGRSEDDILGMVGSAQLMLSSMIGSKDAAADLSKGIAQLSVDIGSAFNVDDSEAFEALKAGLSGSVEPLRRFGVVMNQASLEAFALSRGVKGNFKDLNEAQKTLIRYEFIAEKLKTIQGDAANTADGLANALKGVQGAALDVGKRIGDALLPVVESVVVNLRDFLRLLADNITPEMAKWIAGIAGAVTALAGLTAGLAGLVAVSGPLVVALKAMAFVMLPIIAGLAGTILLVGAGKKLWREYGDTIKRFVNEQLMVAKMIIDDLVKSFKDLKLSITESLGLGKGKVIGKSMASSLAEGRVEAEKLDKKLADVKTTTDEAIGIFDNAGANIKSAFGEGLGVLGGLVSKITEAAGEMLGFKDAADKAAASTKQLGTGNLANRVAGAADKKQGPSTQAEAIRGATEGILAASNGLTSAIVQGFSSGGIAGGVSAAASGFLQQSKAFNKIMDTLNQALSDFIVPLLDAIIAPFQGVAESLGALLSAFTELQLLFSPLPGLLDGLGEFISGVVESLRGIVKGVAGFFAAALDFIADIIDKIPGAGGAARSLRRRARKLRKIGDESEQRDKELKEIDEDIASLQKRIEVLRNDKAGASLADQSAIDAKIKELDNEIQQLTIRRLDAQINAVQARLDKATNQRELIGDSGIGGAAGMGRLLGLGLERGKKLDSEIAALEEELATLLRQQSILENQIDEATPALEDFTDALDNATASLTNVPQGFKAALARFDAANAAPTTNVSIEAFDVRDAFAKFLEFQQFNNFVTAGTSFSDNSGPFAVLREED